MRFLALILLALSAQAHAEQIYLPNIPGYVTGTNLGGGHFGMDISGTISATNPSVGANGSSAPTSSAESGFIDGSGNLQGVSSTNPLPITGSITASNPSVSATASAVPSDATYLGAKNGSGNLTGLLLGSQTSANSLACVLASDQSAIQAAQSGTWNITNVSGTVSLPTGAATAAKQPALGTAGSASSDVITVQGIASMTALKVDGSAVTQPVSGTVTVTGVAQDTTVSAVQGSVSGGAVATKSNLMGGQFLSAAPTLTNTQQAALQLDSSGNLKVNVTSGGGSNSSVSATGSAVPASATYLGVNVSGTLTGAAASAKGLLVDDSGATPKSSINVTGSGSSAGATVSTVATLTAPSNAVGFILMNLDTSTANIRWAVGRTASTTLGQQLQPGRDTGFVPIGADVSIIAESGTQNYDVQWISQ